MRILLFLYLFFFLEKPGEIMTDLTRQECSTPTDKVLGIRQARVSSCVGNCLSELRKFYVTALGSLRNSAGLLHQTLALVSFCYSNGSIGTTNISVDAQRVGWTYRLRVTWCRDQTEVLYNLSGANQQPVLLRRCLMYKNSICRPFNMKHETTVSWNNIHTSVRVY